MKKSVLTLLIGALTATIQLQSQTFTTGFEFGTGKSYIVEDTQAKDYLNYKMSATASISLKYQPVDAYFALRANFLYAHTNFEDSSNGGSWIYNDFIYGGVTSTTTSLLLEHLNTEKKWNFGYNFGMGYTVEDYESKTWREEINEQRRFMSITISGIVALNLGERSSLQFSPVIFWTDPLTSFNESEWRNAAEDVSILFQIGYMYRLN